jgi:hypothetical protein
MERVEALALAIAKHNGAFEPDCEAFRHLNPGMLRARLIGTNVVAGEGMVRDFQSFHGGYRALLDRLQKDAQRNRENLGTVLGYYGIEPTPHTQKKIVNFLRRALGDESITASTPLKYFLEANANG